MSAPIQGANTQRRQGGGEASMEAQETAHRIVQHVVGSQKGGVMYGVNSGMPHGKDEKGASEVFSVAKASGSGIEGATRKGAVAAAAEAEGAAKVPGSGIESATRQGTVGAPAGAEGTAKAAGSGIESATRKGAVAAPAGAEGAAKAHGSGIESATRKGAGAAAAGAEGTAKAAGSGIESATRKGAAAPAAGVEGAAKAAGSGIESATRKGAAAAAAGAEGAAKQGAEVAESVGQGVSAAASGAGKGAQSATKNAGAAAGSAAKGAASAAKTTAYYGGAAAHLAASGAKAGGEGAVRGVEGTAKVGMQAAGQAAATAKAVPTAFVSGARGAVDVSQRVAGTAAAGTRIRGTRRAARTGASALGTGMGAVRQGVEGAAQVVQTLLSWWYLIVVQLPYRVAAAWLHASWTLGSAATTTVGRGAVWFLDTAAWAGEAAYKWLLDGMLRINRGMDSAISATPPLVKGQLARAAVVSAPEGPNLVDSLSNKSPAQVGNVFRGLTAAAAAAKQDPMFVGGGGEAATRGGPGEDLVEQVNAALHAAFDRPPVTMEQGQQPGAAQKTLRSVDALHDRLVDQARLLVWHIWMVGRLQLTAAAEVAAVTRGMWSWLLRCAAQLAAALGLMVCMAWVAVGGAIVAAGAWALASGLQQLRLAAALEVRARRVWGPLVLRVVDIGLAVVGPLLRGPPQAVQRKGPSGLSPLWDTVHGVQTYARESLYTMREVVHSCVPKDPEREEAEAARFIDNNADLAAVLRSSQAAYRNTWRPAQASVAALSDMAGNLVMDMARRYHVPIPKFAWFKDKASQLASNYAIASFARVAGTGPASIVAGITGVPAPSAGGEAKEQANKDEGGRAEASHAPPEESTPQPRDKSVPTTGTA